RPGRSTGWPVAPRPTRPAPPVRRPSPASSARTPTRPRSRRPRRRGPRPPPWRRRRAWAALRDWPPAARKRPRSRELLAEGIPLGQEAGEPAGVEEQDARAAAHLPPLDRLLQAVERL